MAKKAKNGKAAVVAAKPSATKRVAVENLKHPGARRRNIPTAETQAYMREEEAQPKPKLYPRNPDLDPQLVWRGKDEQDAAPLVVPTVPVYIQEKIQPKAIVDDLRRISTEKIEAQADLFADFNGLPDEEARLEFYAHDQNWSNRMILGDALMVMNSLAEKEALKGRVQMIYIDPPYGIRFASNWQPSTKARDVKEGKAEGLTREAEVIKAFRDTWALGIHSYLSYLRDRLVVARSLLSDSGCVFIQIGVDNAAYVTALAAEVFGPSNHIATVPFAKTSGSTRDYLPATHDLLILFAKDHERLKWRSIYRAKTLGGVGASAYNRIELPDGTVRIVSKDERESGNAPEGKIFRLDNLTSQAVGRDKGEGAASWFKVDFLGRSFTPSEKARWKTNEIGMERLRLSARLESTTGGLYYKRFLQDFPAFPLSDIWDDTVIAGFASDKQYVVETSTKVVERCLLMTTDPGDLVLDPTCGSGTTAYVAEQWGRRWITIDTSRVALALARTRLMSARYPFYLMKDSKDGATKEAEIVGRPPLEGPFAGDLRHGFVYERVPHVTLKSIAHNAEIDVIHERWRPKLDAAFAKINAAFGKKWEEWEIPRQAPDGEKKPLLDEWWILRRERQAEIDASIARNADIELLYDRPYEKRSTVRVTGPFTVESLSPHRVLPADEEDEALLAALDEQYRAEGKEPPPRRAKALRPKTEKEIGGEGSDAFVVAVLDNLKKAGVQNTKKKERLEFSEIKPYAGGRYIHAEGRYAEGDKEKRAAIVIGPEYGTVGKELVLAAGREAVESFTRFDLLVICGFAFDPHVGEGMAQHGRLTVLKARMNQDLHMADRLKATGAGNLFVVFGEPDIRLHKAADAMLRVELKGVDIFDPTTGEVRSSADPREDIACWFIDTDYNGESFFVRHAYFLGGKDPYERLKRTLKAEIDEAAWATLYGTESRPFPKPKSGQIAVKVINHYGDEVLKVFAT